MESICRWKTKRNLKTGILVGMDKKHYRKMRKCIFSFLTMFSKGFVFSVVNPFPNKPWFLRVWRRSFLKTPWEKEKLLLLSNFTFSHSVFYPLENFQSFLSNLKLSSAKSVSLEQSKICHFGKGLKSGLCGKG